MEDQAKPSRRISGFLFRREIKAKKESSTVSENTPAPVATDLESVVQAHMQTFPACAKHLRFALAYRLSDPDASLNKTRNVLELVLRDLWEKNLDSPAPLGSPSLLLTNRQLKSCIPIDTLLLATGVLESCNQGSHGWGRLPIDAEAALLKICGFLDWYRTLTMTPSSTEPSPSAHKASKRAAKRRSRRRLVVVSAATALALATSATIYLLQPVPLYPPDGTRFNDQRSPYLEWATRSFNSSYDVRVKISDNGPSRPRKDGHIPTSGRSSAFSEIKGHLGIADEGYGTYEWDVCRLLWGSIHFPCTTKRRFTHQKTLFPLPDSAKAGKRPKLHYAFLESSEDPFVKKDIKNPNKRVGFDIDLIEKVASEMGMDAEGVPLPEDEILPRNGVSPSFANFEVAVSALTIEDNRKSAVGFSSPYFTTRLVVLTHKGMVNNTPLRIYATKNTTSADLIETYFKNNDCWSSAKPLLRGQPGEELAAWNAFVKDYDSAIVIDEMLYMQLNTDYKYDVEDTRWYRRQDYGILLPREDQDFTSKVNKAVESVLSSPENCSEECPNCTTWKECRLKHWILTETNTQDAQQPKCPNAKPQEM